MMRLAGGFRLAALVALGSLPGAVRAQAPWVQISIDPARDVDVGWAEGDYNEDQVRFEAMSITCSNQSMRATIGSEGSCEKVEHATFVLTNRSTVSQAPSELTIASSDPSRFGMVTLTAISGRTTHMTSVMNATGFDVLSFGPGLTLAGGESLTVTVDAVRAQ